jgi:hypothetical protein
VTTPQQAAAEVAERAGTIALQTHQQIAGVVENMSWLPCPHCDERVEVFGSGGGQQVADGLTTAIGAPVPLLGQIPLDLRLRESGDTGRPLVLDDPPPLPPLPWTRWRQSSGPGRAASSAGRWGSHQRGADPQARRRSGRVGVVRGVRRRGLRSVPGRLLTARRAGARVTVLVIVVVERVQQVLAYERAAG